MIMTLQAGDKLMSLTDVSEMLGIPVHTLYRWRYKGDGPVGYRVGRHVRYRREAVEAWLEQAGRPTLVSAEQESVPERSTRH
jgi:excisionase family DNA binding protein